MRYLTVEEVYRLHELVIRRSGGSSGVRGAREHWIERHIIPCEPDTE